MSLPDWARETCPRCQEDIAYVETSKKSKGAPVALAVDFTPDSGAGGTVAVQLTGGKLYGNPVARGQAAGMRAAGVPLHSQHSSTCKKRNTSHRNTS